MTAPKDMLWLSCAAKRCCSARTVVLSGADIWRIAGRLQVPPTSFLRAVAAPPDADDAFALDQTPQRWRAALARSADRGSATCIFLVQPNGAARCGLGAGRPLPCRHFPAVLAGDVVSVPADMSCSCHTWSLADLDIARERETLQQAEAEGRQHRDLVARWNALIAAGAPSMRRTLEDFCTFVQHYGGGSL
jgi:Fe-S-cluster containining protein